MKTKEEKRAYLKEYRIKNAERIRLKKNIYNHEHWLDRKKWYEEHLEHRKKYNKDNKEKIAKQQKEWHNKHKDYQKEYKKRKLLMKALY
jgi:hypothetical protein